MILNGNAFRQNYENYCSGKEYPLKDETKTGAEIHISKFSITEEPICFPFNNRDAQTSHCSKSCSGRIDFRKRIFLKKQKKEQHVHSFLDLLSSIYYVGGSAAVDGLLDIVDVMTV